VTGDDLCSSGRIFSGGANLGDTSEYGLVSALARRCHQGCICPTFADNSRRVNSIIARREHFGGVIYHVLKGCHPCDAESYALEPALKERGLKLLRLETDYTAEDSRNLLTRLEAFRSALL
jgi:benzoyl-CoA reductase/2-hydroxyglutaryl-CoA dehydratase subunit BcrC/BadD/HgdB